MYSLAIVMCGIVGIADFTGRERIHLRSLEIMRDTMVSRGPDDAGASILANGRIGLAHRRLAIISPTSEGRQPLADGTGSTIVFNGEIYNYRELRAELVSRGHAFRTVTDTEVILAAFREWDLDCLSHLRGMFAFALWDEPSTRLIVARDRLGIKPLYYATQNGGFYFASEPRALLAHPSISRHANSTSILDYFSFGYIPWDRSAFVGIQKLPPGMAIVHDAKGMRAFEYWAPTVTSSLHGDAAAEAVRDALDESVRAHLISDVPLGVFLSGGIDSSAVTACAARANASRLRTISVGFDVGESELPNAREMVARYRTDHVEYHANAGDSVELLANLAEAYDEPLADTSTIPTYLMCREARRDVTVALSGDGGDELFAGYSWYARELRRPLPAGRLVSSIVDRVRGLPRLARSAALLRRSAPLAIDRHRHTMCLFDPWEIARLAGPTLAPALRDYDSRWLFDRHFRADLPLLTALQLVDLRTFLVDDILVKVDRAGMAHSLEVRPPLLDHSIVDLAFSIDARTMRRDGRAKWPLRRAMREIVPSSVMDRPKRGFSAPISTWFRAGFASDARRELANGALVEAGWIRPVFVEWMIENYTERRWAKLWSLLVLERWYRRWIAR